MFYVYVLRSENTGRFYVGSATDVERRLTQHNGGHTASTKPYRPWQLVYSEPFPTAAEAHARERQIKRWKNPAYMVKTLGIRELGECPDCIWKTCPEATEHHHCG